MIFGFNTDVKHGDTIYHVQSEAREAESLLQTQVFMRGRCIGKKAISYAASAIDPAYGDPQKEQQLRDQHRAILEAIREGKLDSVLDRGEDRSEERSDDRHEDDRSGSDSLAASKQLDLQWENSKSIHTGDRLTMRLRLTEAGAAVPNARLTFRLSRPDVAPFYTQAITDPSGCAELSLQVAESALPESSVLIQATHEGRTVTRKFTLRKAE
jgi:hypothetical protein